MREDEVTDKMLDDQPPRSFVQMPGSAVDTTAYDRHHLCPHDGAWCAFAVAHGCSMGYDEGCR